MPTGENIARSGRVVLWLAEQMLKDVKPEIFARKPVANGKEIDTNHACFVYGHLATYPAKWLELLGIDAKAAAAPASFADLFAAGKPCLDDPKGTIYPSMKEVTEAFFSSHKVLFESVMNLGDDRFGGVTPYERMRENLPTHASFLTFMTTGHMMMHLGQVSAWRRFMGLGSVM